MNMDNPMIIIRKQIELHESRRGTSGESEEWEEGFIKGMEHLEKLLKDYGDGILIITSEGAFKLK